VDQRVHAGSREINPRLVFERLFSSELPKEVGEGKARREQYRKSILDFVLETRSRSRQKSAATTSRSSTSI
jgi:hypothetical protein